MQDNVDGTPDFVFCTLIFIILNVRRCSNAVLVMKGSDTWITCDGISRTSIQATEEAPPQAASAAAATILVPGGTPSGTRESQHAAIAANKKCDELLHACEECDGRFINAKLLKRHLTRRHGVKFHKCAFPMCNEEFRFEDLLGEHIRTTHL